jgi:hypothetical protein
VTDEAIVCHTPQLPHQARLLFLQHELAESDEISYARVGGLDSKPPSMVGVPIYFIKSPSGPNVLQLKRRLGWRDGSVLAEFCIRLACVHQFQQGMEPVGSIIRRRAWKLFIQRKLYASSTE